MKVGQKGRWEVQKKFLPEKLRKKSCTTQLLIQVRTGL